MILKLNIYLGQPKDRRRKMDTRRLAAEIFAPTLISKPTAISATSSAYKFPTAALGKVYVVQADAAGEDEGHGRKKLEGPRYI
ncbi:hypothetical protein K1719_044123 [Acacia pycnantha]|nr:hypothetical protein K1719_044123 [Acacia pycnantha]